MITYDVLIQKMKQFLPFFELSTYVCVCWMMMNDLRILFKLNLNDLRCRSG